METLRQKKIAALLQKEMAEILRDIIKKQILISITKVRVTRDFSETKMYISVFPSDFRKQILAQIHAERKKIRYELGKKIKNQVRQIPKLFFFADDSLDYIENIEQILKN